MDNRPERSHGSRPFHQPAGHYVVIPGPDASLAACVSDSDGFWSGTLRGFPFFSLWHNKPETWLTDLSYFVHGCGARLANLREDVWTFLFVLSWSVKMNLVRNSL